MYMLECDTFLPLFCAKIPHVQATDQKRVLKLFATFRTSTFIPPDVSQHPCPRSLELADCKLTKVVLRACQDCSTGTHFKCPDYLLLFDIAQAQIMNTDHQISWLSFSSPFAKSPTLSFESSVLLRRKSILQQNVLPQNPDGPKLTRTPTNRSQCHLSNIALLSSLHQFPYDVAVISRNHPIVAGVIIQINQPLRLQQHV